MDRSRSLDEGAILVPGYPPDSWGWRAYAENGRLDPAKRLRDYSPQEWDWLMHAEPTKVKVGGINMTYLGLVPRVRQTLSIPVNIAPPTTGSVIRGT